MTVHDRRNTQFRKVEGRIKAFAIWKGKRTQEWLERQGCLSGGRLDYHDLISDSWALLLKDSKRTFASADDLLRYFTGQISGLVNNIRRSAQAKYSYVSVASAPMVAHKRFLIPEDDESFAWEDDYDQFDREVELQLFAAFLASKAPHLVDLLNLFFGGIIAVPEQATRLSQSIDYVYQMRRKLFRLAKEFALNGENHE